MSEQQEVLTTCGWCGLSHYGPTCKKCDVKMWKSQKGNGWFLAFLLFPGTVVGFFAGLIWGGLRAGFKEGSGGWDQAMKFIRAPKPPK